MEDKRNGNPALIERERLTDTASATVEPTPATFVVDSNGVAVQTPAVLLPFRARRA